MSYIDTAMVGSLGYKATAAIGVVASTTWLFGGICAICGIRFFSAGSSIFRGW